MATATGRSPEALSQQLSLMMNGIVRAQGAMGGFVKSLGMSTEEVKRLAASGDLLQVVLNKMENFERAGNLIQQTFQGVMSNVRDVAQQLAGAFSTPLMNFAKELGGQFIDTFTESWTDQQGNVQTRVSEAGKTMAANFGSGAADGLRTLVTILETILPKFDSVAVLASKFAVAMRLASEGWKDITGSDTKAAEATAVAQLKELNDAGAPYQSTGIRRLKELQGGDEYRPGERAVMNQFLAATTKAREERNADFKAFFDRQIFIQEHGRSPEGLIADGLRGSDSKSKPNRSTIEPAAVRLSEQYRDFAKLFSERMDLGGLAGVEKQFQQIEVTLQTNLKSLDAWEHKLAGKSPEDLAAQGIRKTMAPGGTLKYTGALEEEARQSAVRATIALEEVRQAKLHEGMLALTALTKQTLSEQIDAEEAAGERRIAISTRTATAQARTLAELHEVWEAEARAKDALFGTMDLKRAAKDLEDSGEWSKLTAVLAAQGRNAGQGFTESFLAAFDTVAKKAYAKAETMSEGITAGLLKIRATFKTEGQIIADTMGEVWTHLGDGFANVVSGAITNGIEGIKGAFKGLANSLLNDWIKMIKDMAMSALSLRAGEGKSGFGSLIRGTPGEKPAPAQGKYTGTDENGNPTYAPADRSTSSPVNLGTAAFAALGVASQMSASGSFMGGEAMQVSTAVASVVAMIPGWISKVVAAIVVVIGAIIEALTPRDAEMQATYSGGTMAAALKRGNAFGAAGTDLNKATTQALTINNSMSSFFADLFKDVDPGVRASVLGDLHKNIREYFASLGSFGAHAGGGADFEAAVAKIFSEILPKEILHRMFGQNTNMLADPGGITGQGLAPGGKWGTVSSFSDVSESSPLVSFLTSIGFSIDKVNEIAGQIDVRAAEDFQKYFAKIVTLALSFGTNIENLSKSGADLFADASKSSEKTAIDSFHESALALVQQAKELSEYSGDDQLDRAQKLNDAVAQRYQDELVFIRQITAAVKEQAAAFLSLRMSLSDALSRARMTGPQYDASRVDDWRTRIYGKEMQSAGDVPILGYREQIRNTSDPAKVIELAEKARQAIQEYFAFLNGLLAQNLSILQGFKDLKASFGAGKGGLMSAAMPDASLNGWLAGAAVLKTQVADAAKLTGQAQIDAMKKVQASAAERYAQELGFIRDIQANLASFKQSIAGFKEGVKMDGMSDEEKATYLAGKLRDTEAAMQNTTDPAELKRLQDEIMRYAQQYYGLFKDDDPRKKDAGLYIDEVLDRAQAIAEARATELIDIIASASKEYARVMEEAANITQITIDSITDEIKKLNAELTALETLVRTKLNGVVNDLVTDNQLLAEALKIDKELFLQVNDQLDALSRPGGSVDRVADAFDRLARKFDGWVPDPAPPGGGNAGGPGAAAFYAKSYPYAFSLATGV
jgi:hypothetical protein